MDSPTTAGALLLKLYELRTEASLRQARAWFAFEFHPSSAEDVLRTWLAPGHESAPYRMVTSYWDMAASLVVQGAIPVEMFNTANTEHFALYAKLRPFLADVRAATRYSDYLSNVEHVATSGSDPDARIAIFERYLDRQRRLAAEGRQRALVQQHRVDIVVRADPSSSATPAGQRSDDTFRAAESNDIIVYRDDNHVTASFANTRFEPLEATVLFILAGRRSPGRSDHPNPSVDQGDDGHRLPSAFTIAR